MSDIAIRVEGLGKRYRIGHRSVTAGRRAGWLGRLTGPFQYLASTLREPDQEESFWALKDVSFEVKAGEVVGIIGRNGAGKSTLLKILSRITDPTEGWAEINGRVGSLLEVGTGFHPELTGRENIYMNGAILGMRKAEIDRCFDEIVAFAEIDKFLDTPVKRYSSGMYVRLAFAVAAHLEPEILLVDEVLAVGDAAFQKKCLGKMGDVAKEGRTVLFVSHNIGAIRTMCGLSILMNRASPVIYSHTEDIIRQYLGNSSTLNGSWHRTSPIPTNSGVFFERIYLKNSRGFVTDTLDCQESFRLNLAMFAMGNPSSTHIHARITNEEGTAVFTTSNFDCPDNVTITTPGRHCFSIAIPANFLRPGSYSVIVASMLPKAQLYDIVEDQLRFLIVDGGSHATILGDGRLGIVTPVLRWDYDGEYAVSASRSATSL